MGEIDDSDQLSKPRQLKKEAKKIIGNWDCVMKPQGYPPYFEQPDGDFQINAFDPACRAFDPANVWWLSELCRLVYTPDQKEGRRPWKKVIRFDYLVRAGLEEIHSIHKTGTHAAVYRCASPDHDDQVFHILCFRGTNRFRQWVLNLTSTPIRWQSRGTVEGSDSSGSDQEADQARPYVHSGFKILFDRIWPVVEEAIKDIPDPFIFTGHSLGGALATMASLNRKPDMLVTFGCPRVGNTAFRDKLDHPLHYRVCNHHDIVPLLPHAVDKLPPFDFHHSGDFHYLDEQGALHHNPGGEILANEHWAPDQPLTYLARSFNSPNPPECVLDHSPIQYSRKLAALAVKEQGMP